MRKKPVLVELVLEKNLSASEKVPLVCQRNLVLVTHLMVAHLAVEIQVLVRQHGFGEEEALSGHFAWNLTHLVLVL